MFETSDFSKYDFELTDPFLSNYLKYKGLPAGNVAVNTVMPIIDRDLKFKGVVASNLVAFFSQLLTLK